MILFIYSDRIVILAGRMECSSTRIRTRNMGGNIYRWRKLIQCVRGSTFANERDDPSWSGTRVFPTRPMCEEKRRHPGTSCAQFRAADATQGSIYLTLWLSRVAARTRPRTADNLSLSCKWIVNWSRWQRAAYILSFSQEKPDPPACVSTNIISL